MPDKVHMNPGCIFNHLALYPDNNVDYQMFTYVNTGTKWKTNLTVTVLNITEYCTQLLKYG
jgi:hypothetical protein